MCNTIQSWMVRMRRRRKGDTSLGFRSCLLEGRMVEFWSKLGLSRRLKHASYDHSGGGKVCLVPKLNASALSE